MCSQRYQINGQAMLRMTKEKAPSMATVVFPVQAGGCSSVTFSLRLRAVGVQVGDWLLRGHQW